ncbi:hypothetical protein IAQ61_005387 [Plenodomus lingam]|uniref:uncharacterized protein n=1 Tax=Leptosphaeria maculans TaxID=5022 RepID=UPI00332C445D|nr:hypothetical protein IAQ61_005387 [Plenodomus lingam]
MPPKQEPLVAEPLRPAHEDIEAQSKRHRHTTNSSLWHDHTPLFMFFKDQSRRPKLQERLERMMLTENFLAQEPPKYAQGYPNVAGFMAIGGNLAIFRRFDRMAYLSTLHQQSRLLAVEREIDDMDTLDDDFDAIVLGFMKFWKLELEMVEQYHAELFPPTTTESDLEKYLTVSDSTKKRDSVLFTPLESLRWVEIVLKTYPGKIAPYVVLRGNWRQKVKDMDEFAISLVFTKDDPLELPMVFKHTKIHKKDFTLAATWNFKGTDIRDGGPFRPSYLMGKEFQERVHRWFKSSLPSTEDPYDSRTLRVVIWYDRDTVVSPSGISGAIAIASCNQNLKESIESVEKLRYVCQNDWKSKVIPDQGELFLGMEQKYVAVTLNYIASQNLAALRDRSVMANSTRQEDITRLNALNRLEPLLAAYRSSLMTNAQMSRFEAPTHRGLAALRHWFRGGAMKDVQLHRLELQGLSKGVYGQKEHNEDLVAVGAPSGRDYLSRLTKIILPKVFKVRSQAPMQRLDGIYFYSDTKISTLVSVVGALLGVGLLIGAIVGLDQLDTKAARLGLICALTVAFAMVLLFTTTTTRGEVFGATAAYAAVLVVYVGGALGNTPAKSS